MSFLGFRSFLVIHDSTVSYASSIIRSGANLYCRKRYTFNNIHITDRSGYMAEIEAKRGRSRTNFKTVDDH